MKKAVSGLEWYKKLTMQQRFLLKEMSGKICGMNWEDFTILFSPRERIEILYQKLRLEDSFHCSECNGIDGHRKSCPEFIR